MPVMEVLDADHDGVISAAELKNATAALKTLDKNKDGKLTEDELRPQPGRGPEGGRPGQGAPGRNGQGGAGGRNPNGPPAGGRGGDAGRPPEGRGPGAGGPGGRGGEGRGPEGADGPPPHNPERFLEHAMEFDADKDGKLSKEELLKFAEDMGRRPPPEGGPPEGGPGNGERPDEKGERPRRPE